MWRRSGNHRSRRPKYENPTSMCPSQLVSGHRPRRNAARALRSGTGRNQPEESAHSTGERDGFKPNVSWAPAPEGAKTGGGRIIDRSCSPSGRPAAIRVSWSHRVIGTLRRECFDHLIVLNEQHLRRLVSEYVRFYNDDRPHHSLGLDPPERRLATGAHWSDRRRARARCSPSCLSQGSLTRDRVFVPYRMSFGEGRSPPRTGRTR
jgi:hypothetical protein